MEWTAVAVLVYSGRGGKEQTPNKKKNPPNLETLKKAQKSKSNCSGLVRALLNADASSQNLKVYLLAAFLVSFWFLFVRL